MASLFDKPVAANPQSTFAALPLQYISQSLDRRQAQYEQNKAQVEAQRDEFLSTRAVAGDVERQQALISEWDTKLDDMIEAADGDYSRIRGGIDRMTRDIKQEKAYGELGAIDRNFKGAVKDRENLDKLYQAGKISEAGYNKGLSAMQNFKTTLGDNQQWSTYRGYMPSNITDVQKKLSDVVDEINAKYDESGQKYLSSEDAQTALTGAVKSDPGILKAMQENWEALGSQGTFGEYYNSTLGNVIANKKYHQVLTKKEGGGEGSGVGQILTNVTMPSRGGSSYTGGSASSLKAIVQSVSGRDTFKEFNDWRGSEQGKLDIKWIEAKTKTDMPKNPSDAIDWIEDHLEKTYTASVETEVVPKHLRGKVISDKGEILTHGAWYNSAGELIDAVDIEDLQGETEDGKVTQVLGVVKSGGAYPKGTYHILGKDGEEYFQEPTDVRTLSSPEYVKSVINTAKHAPTGSSTANLSRGLIGNDGSMIIQPGNYETRASSQGKGVALYQNGELMYVLHATPDATGNDITDYTQQ